MAEEEIETKPKEDEAAAKSETATKSETVTKPGAAAKPKTAAKPEEAKPEDASVLDGKTIEEVIREEAVEESPHNFSIARTLGGVIVARYVQRQMGVVLLVCFFIVCYISNRYVCQKKLVEIDKLETKLVKARFKSTVCTSELTEKSRESNVMSLLKSYGDSTLTIPTDPPYLIRVPE